MPRASYLLQLLLALLAAQGFAPEQIDPWRGWVIFKQFIRVADETPDPGASVQISPAGPDKGEVSLALVRQVVEPDDDRLEPVGGVVCEFTFAGQPRPADSLELWSFDFPSFAGFVDFVEQRPEFADLVVQTPLRTAVYWLDAWAAA